MKIFLQCLTEVTNFVLALNAGSGFLVYCFVGTFGNKFMEILGSCCYGCVRAVRCVGGPAGGGGPGARGGRGQGRAGGSPSSARDIMDSEWKISHETFCCFSC